MASSLPGRCAASPGHNLWLQIIRFGCSGTGYGMDALVARPFGKRFVLALILTAALAVQFWTQSRYPSLNEKAIMSGAMQLEDSLSFEALIPVLPEYPWWKKIGISTVNWIKTNERGMTFGALFGAAFLTMLAYLS